MKRGTTEHPKFLKLCVLLNLHKFEAVGLLESLWHFTARFAPQGDIGKFTDKEIARAVEWERPTGAKGVTPECRLSAALVDAGWLDRDPSYRLVVHDWADHADQTVKRFLASRKLAFVQAGASPPLPVPEPVPEPVPVPEPAAPRDVSRPAPIQFPGLPGWNLDETYAPFVEVWQEIAEVTGKPLIEEDFTEAHFRWGRLDFEQKTLAIENLRKRLALGVWAGNTDPQFVPLPKKYLELEYKRPVVAPKSRESPGAARAAEKATVWDRV